MFRIKGAPFRHSGAINVSDCETAEDVIKKANLDWNVAKCELVAKMPPAHTSDEMEEGHFLYGGAEYADVDNFYATCRTDLNYPLGIVKGKYTPVQNIKAFEFFNDAIGFNKAIWQTAGCFDKGRRVFVSAKLPNTVFVGGDPVENYLVFMSSHDGSTGVKILFTPIRIVCENTLSAAIRNATNYVSFRHTASVHDNIVIAKELLEICTMKATFCQKEYTKLAKATAKDEEVMRYICNSVLTDDELASVNAYGYNIKHVIERNFNCIEAANISMRKVNIISNMWRYYFEGPGQKEQVGNWWGAVNAITGYYSNVDSAEGDKRMDSLLYGDKSRKLSNAFDNAFEIINTKKAL